MDSSEGLLGSRVPSLEEWMGVTGGPLENFQNTLPPPYQIQIPELVSQTSRLIIERRLKTPCDTHSQFYVLCAVALVNGTVLVAAVVRKSRLLSKLGNMTKGKDDVPLKTHGAVEEPTPLMVIPSEVWT
ncbi:hypothetical protein PIB30_051047 [Stylosanthes scabra]|uniref:Uncharacterized protein n=1 Tax=Stylosanthes scabra TaxID=79078 RepID=A0ABU6QHP3_9FABA|nr:hypothetical protein [Stylosanthes scabra]